MASSSIGLQEPISAQGGLIGSFYSGKTVRNKAAGHCFTCNEELLPTSKFCGECGESINSSKQTYTNPNLGSEYLNEQRSQVAGTPNFARVSQQMRRTIPPQLKQEYCKVHCLLARERAF